MKLIKELAGKYCIYIIAFSLPWFIVLITSLLKNGWIFGEGTILNGDTAVQLVPFAYELWNKIHTGASMKYTWNIAGGMDFSSILGYYISPFTILILLSSKDFIIDMVQIVMILKWACAAVSMVYFFYHTKYNTIKYHKKAISLFLGMAVILSSSQVNFVRYIQFTDVTICFPILLLLIEKMIDNEKWIAYCLLLAFTIFSNTYMAFEICLFLIIWFMFQLDSEVDNRLKKFAIFAGSSVVSALICAAPIINGLAVSTTRLDNTGADERLLYARRILMSIPDFIRQLFIFSPIHLPSRPNPNVFFSLIGLFLLCLFPAIKINKSKKIYMLSWLIVMLISFFFGAISLVWHIFTPPNGVMHRFSNLFVFTAVFLMMYVLEHLEEIQLKQVILTAMIIIIVMVYTFFNIDNYDAVYIYMTTAILIVLYIILLVLFCKKSISYKSMIAIVVVFGMIELSTNAGVLFKDQYNTSHFSEDDKSLSVCVEMAEKADVNDGERMSSAAKLVNVGLMASKPSISGFNSSISGKMQALMTVLGMAVDGKVLYTTKGASPLINLLFNVRYIVGRSTLDVSDAAVVSGDEICQLYRTDRLAGLGYMVNEDIAGWNPFGENTFDNQNSFASLATGKDNRFFTIVNPDITCTDINGQQLERDEDLIADDAYLYYYKSLYGDVNDCLQAKFTVDEDMDLYADIRTSFNGKISVFVDDEMIGIDDGGYDRSTYHIGNVKQGQEITIVAVGASDFYKGADMAVYLRFAGFDEDAYAEVYEQLSKNIYNIDTMESDYIKGTITADDKGLMMTSIQSQSGFTVYVDGTESGYYEVGGAMMAIPLDEGKHIVEFKYNGVSPKYGKLISILGIIVLAVSIVMFNKNTEIKEHEDSGSIL